MDAKMLEEIKARCDAATAGPWETDYKNRYVFTLPNDGQKMIAELRISGGQISNSEQAANTIFIAHARTDMPALLDHIDAQHNALAKAEADKAVLEKALEKTTSVLNIINGRMPGGTYYKKYEPLANDALMKASAALARVKGEVWPKN